MLRGSARGKGTQTPTAVILGHRPFSLPPLPPRHPAVFTQHRGGNGAFPQPRGPGKGSGGPGPPVPARSGSDGGHSAGDRTPPPRAAAVPVSFSVHLPGEGVPAEPPCPLRFSKPEEPGSHPASPPRPSSSVYGTLPPPPPQADSHPLLARAPRSLT